MDKAGRTRSEKVEMKRARSIALALALGNFAALAGTVFATMPYGGTLAGSDALVGLAAIATSSFVCLGMLLLSLFDFYLFNRLKDEESLQAVRWPLIVIGAVALLCFLLLLGATSAAALWALLAGSALPWKGSSHSEILPASMLAAMYVIDAMLMLVCFAFALTGRKSAARPSCKPCGEDFYSETW